MASPYLETETAIVRMSRALSWLPADSLASHTLRTMSYDLFTDLPREFLRAHDIDALKREVLRRRLFPKRTIEDAA